MKSARLLSIACLAAATLSCARQAAVDEHAGHDMSAMGGSSMQSTQGLPPSTSQTAARLASSPRKSEWVEVAVEGTTDKVGAFVVYPSTMSAKTPVVVVIHENQCLINWNRGVADQVAAEGFIAIAPDLCSKARGGPVNAEVPQAERSSTLSQVTAPIRNTFIAAVAKWAMALPDAAPRYAVIGYCWGGGTVWMHAINGGIPGYSGGVAFYGTAYGNNPDSLAKINKPVLMLNGAEDARIGAQLPTIDSLMKAGKKDYAFMNYKDAVHGFLSRQGDSAFVADSMAPGGRRLNTRTMAGNVEATKDAWPKTVAFLKKNLGMK